MPLPPRFHKGAYRNSEISSLKLKHFVSLLQVQRNAKDVTQNILIVESQILWLFLKVKKKGETL